MYNIVIGVIFIIGGLSGSLALRGTGSTIGLAVVGGAILLFGIIQMSQQRRSAPTSRPQPRRLGRRRVGGAPKPPGPAASAAREPPSRGRRGASFRNDR